MFGSQHLPIPIVLRVWLDSSHERYVDVPITPTTSAADVVDCSRQAGEEDCHLAELWRGCERPISLEEKPYEILQQWGIHRDEVCFYIRHQEAAPLGGTNINGRRPKKGRNGMKENEYSPEHRPVSPGSELSLGELQEMAGRQQQQIEAQAQLLMAKEQRLRYLRQQELRSEAAAAENQRLQQLRQRVSAQEAKLRKLRAIQGTVTDTATNNNTLSSELDSIKALFTEKEKELVLAVQKVDGLSRQLEELRKGQLNAVTSDPSSHRHAPNHAVLAELERLRKEVMLRNKLNEQQNSKLALHRDTLQKRKDDMAKMDSRIAELQHRLRKKKAAAAISQNNPVITAKAGSLPTQKSLEPFHKATRSEDATVPGALHQQDTRYQTLPYNTKFAPGQDTEASSTQNGRPVTKDTANIYDIVKSNRDSTVGVGGVGENNNNMLTLQRASQNHDDSSGSSNCSSPRGSGQNSGSRLMSNFAPKPYGTSYAATANKGTAPLNMSANTTANTTANMTANMTAPSMIHVASGMPQSDSLLDSPKTSTPVSSGPQRPTAREMFMMGKAPPKTPPSAPTTTTTVTTTPPVATVTTTTAAAATTVSKPAVSATMPTVLPVGGRFFPALTVETSPPPSSSSPSTLSPAGLSPQTSAIVRGGSYPVYQVAASTHVPSQVTSSLSSSSSHTPPKTTTSMTSSPPGAVQVVSSHKVQRSERLSTSVESPNAKTAPPPSAALTKSSPQPPSITTGSQKRESLSTVPPTASSSSTGVDTSGTSVSSALSVLMSGGGTASGVSTAVTSTSSSSSASTASKPTYRYAPRSVIANTYMSKLGSGALDQYRKNMSQLYSSFPGGGAETKPEDGTGTTTPGVMAEPSTTSPTKPSPSAGPSPRSSPQQPPEQPASFFDSFSNGPATPSKDAERLRYRPNAPRPLRRRLSTGESPPTATTTAPKGSIPRGADIIRVDAIQDAYNNNNFAVESTSFTGPDNIPFADDAAAGGGGAGDAGPNRSVSPARNVSPHVPQPLRKKKGSSSLKSRDGSRTSGHKRRVSFDPLALLLDASLEGELELVKQCAGQVPDPSQANDEGITALHNTICAGHFEIVKFLVEFGCNVNSPDSDGWTPLHCAASCNNLPMVRLLVEHGACIFATTISDHETAAEKCEEDEDGYDGCSDYLYSIQEKLGIVNGGVVYAVFDYAAEQADELSFKDKDALTVLRKGDDREREWWWSRRNNGREGYIPRNLLGLYPRIPLQSLKDTSNTSRNK